MTISFTKNLRWPKPDFLQIPWQAQVTATFDAIDTTVYNLVLSSNISTWQNATAYVIGNIVVSPQDGSTWMCQVAHTSATSPTTFSTDRANHPTFWTSVALSIRFRGQWLQNTVYNAQDVVYDTTGGRSIYAICITQHTSTAVGTINTDAANWTYIFNGATIASAAVISYDHSVSLLSATTVQAAIDELVVDMNGRYVRFDINNQGLTSPQKTNALTNLGLTAQVPTSRLINTTAPLAGGGNLSADLTLSLSIGASFAVVTNQLRTVAMTGDITTAANSLATTADPKFVQTGVSKTMTVGHTFTPNNIGTVSSGTTTPNPALGNYQFYTNNGAHTLAAPSSDCGIDILITNGATAGTITFSGFAGGTTGDALTTTNGNQFICSIRRINGVSARVIKALQ